MASRGASAAATALRALRSTTGRPPSSLQARRRLLLLLNNHLHHHRSLRHSSALSAHCCAPTTAPALSRLFSADAASAPVPSKVVLVKDDAHYAEVMKDIGSKDNLAVVYFTAQWCGPCKQIAPYIDQLSQQFGDVAFLKIDVDKVEVEQTMLNSKIGVVPTFHFHKKGQQIGELTGAVKDKLKNLVESLRLE